MPLVGLQDTPIMGRKLAESLFEQYCSMGDYQWRPSGFD
jgi:hypothetical protein